MLREAVVWQLDILATQELCYFIVGEVKVESPRMVEVVFSSIFVLLMTKYLIKLKLLT